MKLAQVNLPGGALALNVGGLKAVAAALKEASFTLKGQRSGVTLGARIAAASVDHDGMGSSPIETLAHDVDQAADDAIRVREAAELVLLDIRAAAAILESREAPEAVVDDTLRQFTRFAADLIERMGDAGLSDDVDTVDKVARAARRLRAVEAEYSKTVSEVSAKINQRAPALREEVRALAAPLSEED